MYPQNPYAQNPYAQNPYAQQQLPNQYYMLEEKIRQLEARQNGNYVQSSNMQVGNVNNDSNSTSVSSQSSSTKSFIIVTSPDEAWSHMPDLSGTKQFYLDDVNGAFYVKWFDASVPKTYRETYKRVEDNIQAEATTQMPPAEDETLKVVEELTIKVDGLHELIKEMTMTKQRNSKGEYVKKAVKL